MAYMLFWDCELFIFYLRHYIGLPVIYYARLKMARKSGILPQTSYERPPSIAFGDVLDVVPSRKRPVNCSDERLVPRPSVGNQPRFATGACHLWNDLPMTFDHFPSCFPTSMEIPANLVSCLISCFLYALLGALSK